MALALAADARLRLHVFHDERSASFCALGLGLATGRPALLLCTSGTAAAEFHAAVVEAHQAAVPLLVVTADRPPELQGVGAPQTIDQRELYGRAVRWFCEPGPPAAGGAPWWRDLARDAWSRTLGTTPGPVHLNLAFREPLLGTPGQLPAAGPQEPPAPAGASWGLLDEELGRLAAALAGRRGVIVAGARAALGAADGDAVLGLADALGWPVLADGPSGCRRDHPAVVTAFDPILRHEAFAAGHRPEVVLRLGGLLASKVTNQWLATSGALQVGLDRFGLVPDPDRVLARSLPADIATACAQLTGALQAAVAGAGCTVGVAQRLGRRRGGGPSGAAGHADPAGPGGRAGGRRGRDGPGPVGRDPGGVVVHAGAGPGVVRPRPGRRPGPGQPGGERDRRRHLDRGGRGPHLGAHGPAGRRRRLPARHQRPVGPGPPRRHAGDRGGGQRRRGHLLLPAPAGRGARRPVRAPVRHPPRRGPRGRGPGPRRAGGAGVEPRAGCTQRSPAPSPGVVPGWWSSAPTGTTTWPCTTS